MIATALSALHVLAGLILIFINGRRVYPYILETCMLIIFPILLAIVLASPDGGKATVQRDFNFITCSSLAGVTILSIILTYPVGIKHVQELVPWMHHGHEDVLNAGEITLRQVTSISGCSNCGSSFQATFLRAYYLYPLQPPASSTSYQSARTSKTTIQTHTTSSLGSLSQRS